MFEHQNSTHRLQLRLMISPWEFLLLIFLYEKIVDPMTIVKIVMMIAGRMTVLRIDQSFSNHDYLTQQTVYWRLLNGVLMQLLNRSCSANFWIFEMLISVLCPSLAYSAVILKNSFTEIREKDVFTHPLLEKPADSSFFRQISHFRHLSWNSLIVPFVTLK